ncbi:MAG: hypothetical protein FWB91_01245 [Defluviitaleaceae bacterium]|nr:hypothetical protein [Defluviitaleaceae bacterium]
MDKSNLKIYLDNCCYNRPFDNQGKIRIRLETEAKLHVQSSIRTGLYDLCWSFMLDYENDKNPHEENRYSIGLWKRFASDFCPPSEATLNRGKEFMKHGIKNADALHIACAIERHCEYFLTTDKKILNKVIDGIRIISPIEFVGEMESIL